MNKTLADVFEDLSYGPFAGLSIGNEGTGHIPTGQQGRVVSLLNVGLKRLYSRFDIMRKTLSLETMTGRLSYPLLLAHAVTNEDVADKFIIDTVGNPFRGDVIKVISVYDPEGHEMLINITGEETSLMTPQPHEIVFPEFEEELVYQVLYKASHPRLTHGDMTQKIILPAVLDEALLSYVGAHVLSGMNGQEHQIRGAELRNNYEAICAEVEQKDHTRESMTSEPTKLESRGFV